MTSFSDGAYAAGGRAQPWLTAGVDGADDRARVVLTGELDADTLPTVHAAVQRALDGPATGPVEVDTSALTFLDSSGLRCLIECAQRCEAAGRRLVLARPSPLVRQILEITDLAGYFGPG
jgi:anti-anti-sigma factor